MIAATAICCWAPFRKWVLPFIPDDAFYYLEIARRIGSGEGSTFDGITRTNGYHPLWLLMLIPLSHWMNVSRELGVRAAMAIGIFLMAAAFLLLLRLAKKLCRSTASLAILIPASILFFSSNYGMESPLTNFLFVALFWWESKFPLHVHGVRTGLATGLVSGLLVLSRLDTAVYVAVMDIILLLHWMRYRTQPSWRKRGLPFITCVAVQLAMVGGYLVYGHFVYGHFLPINAMLKMARHQGTSFAWLTASWGAVPAVVATGMGVVAYFWRKRRAPSVMLTTSVFGNVAYMALVGFKGGPETYHWYFALPLITGGLFAGLLVAAMHRRNLAPFSKAYMFAFACALLLLVASIGRRFTTPNNRVKQLWFDKAVWISQCSRKTAILAATDCGILGYFSQRSVINLDGLTGSFEFQEAMRDQRLASFLWGLGLNTAVTTAGRDDPPQNSDGTYHMFFRTYPGLYTGTRVVKAIVEPELTPSCSTRFRLWRIRQLTDVALMEGAR
jgi:hypothetical protein